MKDKLTQIRNNLYNNLPTGEVNSFDLIKLIKKHLSEIDVFIDDMESAEISKLPEDKQFHITLVSILNSELVKEQIITPTQKHQIEKYILSKIGQ